MDEVGVEDMEVFTFVYYNKLLLGIISAQKNPPELNPSPDAKSMRDMNKASALALTFLQVNISVAG